MLTIEKVSLAWVALTSVLMAAMWGHLADPMAMVWTRVVWGASTALLILLCQWLAKSAPRVTELVRTGAQLGWLATWYPETYEMNCWRDNLDWMFAQTEWDLFGFQPSLEMCRWLDSPVWSELFNLGYFSYFPMIAVLIFGIAWNEWRKKGSMATAGCLETGKPSPIVTTNTEEKGGVNTVERGAKEDLVGRVGALVEVCFFLYYIIYIALPVTGPQFYFAAIGLDNAAAGIYPHLGTYFSTHTDMLPAPGWDEGLFHNLVHWAHETGERPTAAFPSSHIGISTIVFILSWRHARQVVPVIAPLWLLLCCATVYIQAHYVIDAIAGLISAPIMLFLAHLLLYTSFNHGLHKARTDKN